MGQNKLDSFIEAVINVCLGFGISVLANFVIFPLVGITASTNQVMLVGIFMTVVSVARSYFVRRWANTWLVPARIWVSSIFRKEVEMNFNYEVETLVKDNSILQSVYSDFEGVRERMFSEILDLREATIRESLIKLGWTPPKETKVKAEQEDNYEEALCLLYDLTNLLCGGYYEPKSVRDIELADALHDVWVKFRYSEETMNTFEAVSDPKNKHLFTTEKSLEYFKNVKIKES